VPACGWAGAAPGTVRGLGQGADAHDPACAAAKTTDHANARPEGDTLAACVTQVIWTPVRRLAGRSALQAALDSPGRRPAAGTRPSAAGTRMTGISAARPAAGTQRASQAGTRTAGIPTAATATAATATTRSRVRNRLVMWPAGPRRAGRCQRAPGPAAARLVAPRLAGCCRVMPLLVIVCWRAASLSSRAALRLAALSTERLAALRVRARSGDSRRPPARRLRSTRQASSPRGTRRPPVRWTAARVAARRRPPGRWRHQLNTATPSPTIRYLPSPTPPPMRQLPRPGQRSMTARHAPGGPRRPGLARHPGPGVPRPAAVPGPILTDGRWLRLFLTSLPDAATRARQAPAPGQVPPSRAGPGRAAPGARAARRGEPPADPGAGEHVSPQRRSEPASC
jgi:hypothetical protein